MRRLSKDILEHLSDHLGNKVVSLHLLPQFSNFPGKNSFYVVYIPSTQKYIKIYLLSDLIDKGINEYNNVKVGGCRHDDDEFSLGLRLLDKQPGKEWVTTYLKTWDIVYKEHILSFLKSDIDTYDWFPDRVLLTDKCIGFDWLTEEQYRQATPSDLVAGTYTDLFKDIICKQHMFQENNTVRFSDSSITTAFDQMNDTDVMRDRWTHTGEWCLSFEYNYITDFYISIDQPDKWKYVDIENLWVHKPNYRYIVEHSTTVSENGASLSKYININEINTTSQTNIFYFNNNQWSSVELDKIIK